MKMAVFCLLLLAAILGNGCGYTIVQRSEYPARLHQNYNRVQYRRDPAPQSVDSWYRPSAPALSKVNSQRLLELYYLIRAIKAYRRPHVAHHNTLDRFIQELQDDAFETRLRALLRKVDGFEEVSTLGMYNDGQSMLELLQKEYYVNDYRLLIPAIHRVLDVIRLDELETEFDIHEKLLQLKDHVKELTVNLIQTEEELYRGLVGPKVAEQDSWTVEDVLASIFQKQEGDVMTEFKNKYDLIYEDDKPLDTGSVEELWVILEDPEQYESLGEETASGADVVQESSQVSDEIQETQLPELTHESVWESVHEPFPSPEGSESQGIEEPELDYFNKHYGVFQVSPEMLTELPEPINTTSQDRSDSLIIETAVDEKPASLDYTITEEVMPEVIPASVESIGESVVDLSAIKDEDAIVYPGEPMPSWSDTESSEQTLNSTLPEEAVLAPHDPETTKQDQALPKTTPNSGNADSDNDYNDPNFVFESDKLAQPIDVSEPADLVEPQLHIAVDGDGVKQTEPLPTVQSIPLWLLKNSSSVDEDASLRELEEDESFNETQSSVPAEPENREEPSRVVLEVDLYVLRYMKEELVKILNQLVETQGFHDLRESITDGDVSQLVDQLDQDEMMKLVGGDDINRPELISVLQKLVVDKELENGDKIVAALEQMKNGEDDDDGYFETNYGVGQGDEEAVEGRALDEYDVEKWPLELEEEEEEEEIDAAEEENIEDGDELEDTDLETINEGETVVTESLSNEFNEDNQNDVELSTSEATISLGQIPEQVLPEWVSADNLVSRILQDNVDSVEVNPEETNGLQVLDNFETIAEQVFPYNRYNVTVISTEEQLDDGYFEKNYGVGQDDEEAIEGRDAVEDENEAVEEENEDVEENNEAVDEENKADEGEPAVDIDSETIDRNETVATEKLSIEIEEDNQNETELFTTEPTISLEQFPEQVLPEWVSADNLDESLDSKILRDNVDSVQVNPEKTNRTKASNDSETTAEYVFPYDRHNVTVISHKDHLDSVSGADEIPSKIFPSNVGNTRDDIENRTPRNDISEVTAEESDHPKRKFIQPFPVTVPTETKPVEVGRAGDEENILSQRSKHILAD